MSRRNETTYAKIKEIGATPGYVLDNIVPLEHTDPQVALYGHMKKCIKEIEEGRGERIKHFYIGKSFIREKKNCKFDIHKPTTWRVTDGVSKCYSHHRENKYGRNGLIVLTALTDESIPHRWKTHHEEYALMLEKHLIQNFKDDKRLANLTVDPGITDKGQSVAYAVYMAFTLDDKDDNYKAHNKDDSDGDSNINSQSVREDSTDESEQRDYINLVMVVMAIVIAVVVWFLIIGSNR